MAVLLSEIPETLAGDALPHKTWTRAELAVLESAGLLANRHFELIEGELIDKMGKKRPHVIATTGIMIALQAAFGSEHVNVEAPIDISPEDNPTNEPEPDIIVLRRPYRSLRGNPTPGDLALAVEVSDTTLRHDLRTKARLYARAGIAEYWVLDIAGRRLHVLRNPAGDAYSLRTELDENAAVSPLAAPDRSIAVRALLP